MKKFLLAFIGGLLINTTFAASSSVQLVEGKDYTLLSTPVQKTVEPKGRVNVKEFFSFACIHCKDIEPLVEQGIVPNKKIDLDKIHIVWGDQSELVALAKLSATIQALNLNQLNVPVFNAVFSRQDLSDPKNLKPFLSQNGLKPDDVNKFMSTYNSFTIAGKTGEYKNLVSAYNVTGTPTFVIADKYVASPALPARLVVVVQALVDKALAEQSKK